MPLDTLITALAPMCWGTTYLVTSQLLPPGYPVASTVLRALPAGLVLLAGTRNLPSGSWWWRAAVLGCLNIALFNMLLFFAAYHLPGGVAATLNSVQPLFTAGFAFALLREPPSRWRLAWSLVGVVGVGLMVLRASAALDPSGLVAGTCAAGVMACGVVLTRRWGRPEGIGPATLAGWQLTAGGLTLLPFAVVFEGAPPINGAAAAGYLWLGLFGGLIAYVLWFRGLALLPVVAASFLTLLSPVVATILGWLVLGQALSPPQLVGFVVALGSIVAAQTPPKLPKATTDTTRTGDMT